MTIQHSFGSFSHINQRRKRNKRNPNWKRRSKTLTVCRTHDPYIENPKDTTRKLLELVSEYSKVAGYKEKAMVSHSVTLAWKIPWMEEPGGLQSMGSLGVRHGWVTSLSLFTFMHWSRKWQPTPVFLPGESQGWRSLVGCHLWDCTESGTTKAT